MENEMEKGKQDEFHQIGVRLNPELMKMLDEGSRATQHNSWSGFVRYCIVQQYKKIKEE